MAKRLTLFSLRLMLLTVVADVLAAILMGIQNQTVQWIIDILLTLSLWIFVWMDSVGYGQKDVKKDKMIKHQVEEAGYTPVREEGRMFKPWFGFAAGLLSQLPALLLILVICFTGDSIRAWLNVFLNIWNLSCLNILTSVAHSMIFVYLVPPVLFAVVSGLGYLNGPNQQRRLETIIERNKSKKAKRVQDDIKNKQKKRGQNRK